MFEYDVFLSYSSKDKSIVHDLANRLKQDGVQVWLDKWTIKFRIDKSYEGQFIAKAVKKTPLINI